MNVLNVAHPLAKVGRETDGSAERVIAALDDALIDAGHGSFVVAHRGSPIRGTLLDIKDSDDLSRVLDELSIDLIHLHGIDVMSCVPTSRAPMVATLHLPPSWYPSGHFDALRPPLRLTCVSHSQRQACSLYTGDAAVDVVATGVDLDLFTPVVKKHDYVVAVGVVAPEKGFHLALEAARLARVPMRLAGDVAANVVHQQYFRDSIVPRLDAERLFVGHVAGLRKRMLLARARALIVPSLIDETTSIVAMEALACGTPVIGMRRGALPEIVNHGVTGFLVSGFLEMVEAIENVGALAPAACRTAAEEHFDVEHMKRGYMALYERELAHTRRLEARS